MSQLTVDATLSAKLRDLAGPVEIVDESGRILGRYVPQGKDTATEGQISAEELARRRQEPGGRPLAEILADLEKQA